MQEKEYQVIRSEKLSQLYDDRFVVVEKESGKLLDDAQGYGYRSIKKAHAGYGYKNRDKSKDREKKEKKKAVESFIRHNRAFMDNLEDLAFHIAKGSYGPEEKLDAKTLNRLFKESGYTDLPFTAGDFLKHW